MLEPQIGQSKSINAVAGMLKIWGAKTIKVECMFLLNDCRIQRCMCFLYWADFLSLSLQVVTVCISEESINCLLETHPDIQIYCAAIDQTNNGSSLIPGIGDAGDRQFLGPVYDCDSDVEICYFPE